MVIIGIIILLCIIASLPDIQEVVSESLSPVAKLFLSFISLFISSIGMIISVYKPESLFSFLVLFYYFPFMFGYFIYDERELPYDLEADGITMIVLYILFFIPFLVLSIRLLYIYISLGG